MGRPNVRTKRKLYVLAAYLDFFFFFFLGGYDDIELLSKRFEKRKRRKKNNIYTKINIHRTRTVYARQTQTVFTVKVNFKKEKSPEIWGWSPSHKNALETRTPD